MASTFKKSFVLKVGEVIQFHEHCFSSTVGSGFKYFWNLPSRYVWKIKPQMCEVLVDLS